MTRLITILTGILLTATPVDLISQIQGGNTDGFARAERGRSNDFYLGQDTLGGIVFCIYTGSDGKQHGLIVSKTETKARWQSARSTTGANSYLDGVYNTRQMTNSPVKNWVRSNFSDDWYIPSINELNILWKNRVYVNKALKDGGYTIL
ncbi:hypothetical protein ACFLSA_06410 [Bacteroidota bacterium]